MKVNEIKFRIHPLDGTSYSVAFLYSVTEATITATTNDSAASYVIKVDGEVDDDGVVSLGDGFNNPPITIEVTAADGTTTKTYRLNLFRYPPSEDAKLKALTLSGIDIGTFTSGTTSYSALVANSVSQTTVTPTVNQSDATYVIKVGGVEDEDGTVSLAVGENVVTIEVTAQDGETTQTYTVTVTRAAPPSSDATLSGLTLSDVNIGTFVSGITSYTADVASSVTETTVTPNCESFGGNLRHQAWWHSGLGRYGFTGGGNQRHHH